MSLGEPPIHLLEHLVDQRGYPHLFSYDSLGRLEHDEDPAGGYKALVRTESPDAEGYKVSVTSALGRTTTYSVEPMIVAGALRINPDGTYTESPGQVVGTVLKNTWPSGAQSITQLFNDTYTITWSPDNALNAIVRGPDPRFGMQAPMTTNLLAQTPGELHFTTTVARSATLANPDDLMSLLTQTDWTTVNGRTYTTVYDNTTKRITTTTPAGRRAVSRVDGISRLVSVQADNTFSPPLLPVTFSYDTQGRLHRAGQDDNLWTYLYDSKNRLQYKIDPLDNVVEYGYDDADRVNMVRLPSGRTYRFEYDRGGNRTKVIMPNLAEHQLGYTPVDLDNSYQPPLNPPYAHQYSLDREWTSTTLPSGRAISAGYDSASAKLLTVSQPDGTVEYWYADNSYRIFNLTRTGTDNSVERIDFDYDGFLTTMASYSGASNGEYRYAYDDNFWVMRIALDNVWNVLGRDNDGLLTGNGPFTIGRHGPAGASDNVADLLPRSCGLDNTGLPVDCLPGTLQQTYGYDNTGRLARRTQTVNSNVVYEMSLDRDRVGRIIRKTETIGAASPVVWRYDYDVDGQVKEVWKDEILVEQYGYDNNANRNMVMKQTPPTNLLAGDFDYDTQDRLLRMGTVSYVVDTDGYLAQRGTDNLAYSARGELLSATVGGETTTYHYDGTGRRVARTDAQGTTQYLYGNLSQPFQITASRNPDNVLTMNYYDDFGALYALERGGVRYYVGSDHLGTPKVVTDNTGTIVRQIEYDSWGVKVSDTNPSFDLPVGFAGGIPDDAMGLVRFGFRDYEPATGRWAAKDPIFFRGGQPNLYVYTFNDPVNFFDHDGLTTWPANGRITSPFGNRIHPITGTERFHRGIDIANPVGSPVVASDSGTVIRVYRDPDGGNTVIIRNNDGSISGYAHTNYGVYVGEKVGEGDQIGNTDMSGSTNGGHVHYSYRSCQGGKFIDPFAHLMPSLGDYW